MLGKAWLFWAGLATGIALWASMQAIRIPEAVSEGAVPAPYINLSKYEVWAIRDSTTICIPEGCAPLPDGTLVLIPPPRQTPKKGIAY